MGVAFAFPRDEGSIRGPLHPDILFKGVGVGSILILGFTAVVRFFPTLSILQKGSGPRMGNTLVLMPAFVGLFLAAYGFSHEYSCQSQMSWFNGSSNPSESGPILAAARAANNVRAKLWFAMFIVTPGYLLAVITMFRRCLCHEH